MAKFYQIIFVATSAIGLLGKRDTSVCISVCLFAGHELGRCVYLQVYDFKASTLSHRVDQCVY